MERILAPADDGRKPRGLALSLAAFPAGDVMPVFTKRAVAMLAAWALAMGILVAGPMPFIAGSRTTGDLRCAQTATLHLLLVRTGVPVEGTSSRLRIALNETSKIVDTFLLSDAGERLPVITRHVDRAWRAYEVAEQLWRTYDDGVSNVPVGDVYGARELLEEAPGLSVITVDHEGAMVVDNSDLKAVKALLDYAKQQEESARALIRARIDGGE
ncbi:MAG: hypothetical protein EG825_15875 [Rhodocyclaceae bacterium]|nr:hypothetical protein [Rhodocyclaceae bacterium]